MNTAVSAKGVQYRGLKLYPALSRYPYNGSGVAVAALLGAALIHLGVASPFVAAHFSVGPFARDARDKLHAELQRHQEVELEPLPPPEPEPPAPEPERDTRPTHARHSSPRTPTTKASRPAPPPPAAAQAAKTLTAEPDPNEPLDLTDNTFVQGTGNSYAGGVTASAGTSGTAVRSRNASASGVAGGRGISGGGEDRSRGAEPLSKTWGDCPWPPEAALEQIDHARVQISVTVSPSGKAVRARALSKMGFGFEAAAERCAMGKPYTGALDRSGEPVVGTATFWVTWNR